MECTYIIYMTIPLTPVPNYLLNYLISTTLQILKMTMTLVTSMTAFPKWSRKIHWKRKCHLVPSMTHPKREIRHPHPCLLRHRLTCFCLRTKTKFKFWNRLLLLRLAILNFQEIIIIITIIIWHRLKIIVLLLSLLQS